MIHLYGGAIFRCRMRGEMILRWQRIEVIFWCRAWGRIHSKMILTKIPSGDCIGGRYLYRIHLHPRIMRCWACHDYSVLPSTSENHLTDPLNIDPSDVNYAEVFSSISRDKLNKDLHDLFSSAWKRFQEELKGGVRNHHLLQKILYIFQVMSF